MEVDLSLITNTLRSYSLLNPILAIPDEGPPILPNTLSDLPLVPTDFTGLENGSQFIAGEKEYRVDIRKLNKIGVSLYNCTDISAISIDNRRKTYALGVVVLSVVLTSLGIGLIITNYITKPIHKLINRIRRISESDFSVDLSAEARGDEIGEVFKVINEMSLSIDKLLKDNEEKNEQKKNIEIDLLQSQVNPHFLYNTLDSIHWMAVIQKNPGICSWLSKLSQQLCRQLEQISASKSDLAEKARSYVIENVDKHILLQDAADYVNLSPSYLSALFKKEFHQNFVDFINETKIDRACELIREDKYRIYEISYMLGYDNAYYFTKVFKKHTGLTPTEYQRRKR